MRAKLAFKSPQLELKQPKSEQNFASIRVGATQKARFANNNNKYNIAS